MSETSHAANQDLLSDLPENIDWARLIPRYDEDITHPNCLIIAPFRKSARGPTIMATVEHYLQNPNPGGFPWTIRSVTSEPLLLKAAVTAAFHYAKANKVAVIYLNQDGFSTEDELAQSDTRALKTGAPTAR